MAPAPGSRIDWTPLAAVRRGVLLSCAIPPLRWAWLLVYAALARAIGWLLARDPRVAAVYLQRGAAKGELFPGISDLDFGVVVRGGPAAGRIAHRNAVLALPGDWFHRLARASHLIDPHLETWEADRLREMYATRWIRAHRFWEGQQTWRRLHGEEFIRRLPPLSPEDRAGALYAEMQVWWSMFAQRFLQAREPGERGASTWAGAAHNEDPITQRAICYKVVIELARLYGALRTDNLLVTRDAGLRQARCFLAADEAAFLDELETLARRRFLAGPPHVVDTTLAFLTPFIDRVLAAVATLPLTASLGDRRTRIDWDAGERLIAPATRLAVERFAAEIEAEASNAFHAQTVFHAMDAVVLLVERAAGRPPTRAWLRSLTTLHRRRCGDLHQRVELYLLTEHGALHLAPGVARLTRQTLPLPAMEWDLFTLLARPECVLRGAPRADLAAAAWNPATRYFLHSDPLIFHQEARTPPPGGWAALGHLSSFYKCCQLEAMKRAVAAGELLYPLTPTAVERALAEQGAAFPAALRSLADAYQRAIAGEAVAIEALAPAMEAYLRQLAPDGDVFRPTADATAVAV